MNKSQNNSLTGATRRQFLQTTALGAGALMGRAAFGDAKAQRPNFLFIISDQLGLDAISAHGCPDVHTPNIDRLVKRGVTFMESHSTNPVCSPARSSMFTGRMPTETGVISNSRPIHPSRPNMGQWFSREGYEAVYCGKWHLPGGYPAEIEGFTVLPTGGGQGALVDSTVSASCEAYLKNRNRGKPFVLAASLLQPHDICYWAIQAKTLVPEELAFPQIADRLPKLPPNHRARPRAPKKLDQIHYDGFSDAQWRYYLYIYYRQVEMVDGDIGRILDALEDSGQADNTIVIFTADHGEGRGRHMLVSKWYPYDEAVKVPLIVSCPGRMTEGLRDAEHLVSGLDIMSTMCDYAGIQPPPDCLGRSLRPLLERRPTEWREFVASEHRIIGRSIRTPQFKYVRYEGDPVEQLFDMKADPWETKNLYDNAKYASVVKDHQKLLDEWEARLKTVEPTPNMSKRRRRRGKKK
ncbi:MAG: sulfatase-like hydrolase/transferase [Planctomycetes bacterium]|nr:sulfatase-like hydrolase/transferase [Planctomycetota bacterium]